MTATAADSPSADLRTGSSSIDLRTGSSSTETVVRRPIWTVRRRNDVIAYGAAILGSVAATVFTMKLWLADLSIPFTYSGDGVSSAAHVKATMQWGWYENQLDLGAPYGQNYHDVPFGDNLPLVFAKVAGWFTNSWPVVFNLYFLLGFPLAAVTALWFLRQCGVSRPIGVALAVLFAMAPYHWLRGESHFFLSGYWAVPIGVWVALTVLRGRGLWAGRRVAEGSSIGRRALGAVTGRGALVAVGLAVLATSAAYYGVFTAVVVAFCGVVALVRTHSWRRFFGAAVAGGWLVVVVIGNVIPDLLYERANGANTAGLIRPPADAEVYALKITSLVLPAPGHRLAFLAKVRNWYDSQFPLASEQPALGLVGALGLGLAFSICFYAMTRGLRSTSDQVAAPPSARMSMLVALSSLTLLMVLLATVGGVGTFLSFVSASLRGWNRMSILIALACLAIVGLAVDAAFATVPGRVRRRAPATIAGIVLALAIGAAGVFDQAIAVAVPQYDQVRAAWQSDSQFVDQLEQTAGTDAMLFQAPFIPFPESPPVDNAFDSDMVKLSLHSTTLRWSGGGLKGRPRSDWPLVVAQLPIDQMALAVAKMGFAGIVTDSNATPDSGEALLGSFTEAIGAPTLSSADGRWHYFALTEQVSQVAASSTPQERADFVQLMLSDPGTAVARFDQ